MGNLGTEVNDDVLTKAFAKYPSFNKAKVIRQRSTNKSKGYGFVSFGDLMEGAKVLREMEGKYVGNRPCKLKRSDWQRREVEATEEQIDAAAEKLSKKRLDPKKEKKSHHQRDKRKHVNVLHK